MNTFMKKRKKENDFCNDDLGKELKELLKSLTHSGKAALDVGELNKVETICKQAEKYVEETFRLTYEHLKEHHAEVRRSSFQICDFMFWRFPRFREKVIQKMEGVVKLTTGKDLPRPYKVAEELKCTVLRTVHKWNAKFGRTSVKLYQGHSYLYNVHKDFFDKLESANRETKELSKKSEDINRERCKKVLAELRVKEVNIKEAATALSTCINLLLPHPDDFFIVEDNSSAAEIEPAASAQQQAAEPDSDDSDEGSQNAGLREVGMVNLTHSIQLEFVPSSEVIIEETSENTDVIENTKEYAKLINVKYLPFVKSSLEILSKLPEYKEERKQLLELRGDLEDAVFKFSRMTFRSAEDVSSDSDLEEVPTLKTKPPEATITRDPTVWTICSDEGNTAGSVKAPLIGAEEPQASTSAVASGCDSQSSTESQVLDRKQKLLAVAPKRPYDIDLYHWEDEKLPVPTMIPSSTDGHRFWVGSDSQMEELPTPEGSAALRTRVIEFAGEFTPVTHSCKVRLPSGKLCPRRDRIKCPFHGEIVPRDDAGNCTNPEDAMRMQALLEKRQQEKPDWQDPKLLAELKKTTGLDLKMPVKGQRKKRKNNYPGLTDLKALENTSTKRLEKKIFKKSAVRKVAAAMDRADQRKFSDKFSDQFQYFYNS